MTAIFEMSGEAILVADDSRRYVAANPAACELIGRPLADVLRMRVGDLGLREDRPRVEKAWAALMADGAKTGERVLVRPGGERRYAEYRVRANIRPGLHVSMLRDVTDRVLAERALEAVQAGPDARYRLIAEHASDLVLLVSERGLIEWVSSSVTAATGWNPDELVGHTTAAFLDESQLLVVEEHRRKLAQRKTFRIEMPVLTRHDGPRWMEFTISPVAAPDGTDPGWVGTVRDIQARREAEEALRVSRDLMAAVIGATDEAVYAKDTVGRYILYNAVAAGALGKTEGDVLGRDDTELFAPDEAAEIIARDREILAAGVTLTVDEHLTLADGRSHWLLSTKGPIRAADGSLMGLFGVSRDITDRVAAEEALRQSERRLRELYQGVDSILFHRDGDDPSVVLNPSAARMLGYPVDRLGDRAFWDSLVHPDDIARAHAAWAADRSGWDMQYRLRRADGTWVWVRDRANRTYNEDGSVERVFGFVSDVTEFHAVEEQLARANRLESLGRLASGLAHDFNNVLVGIGLIADWIQHHPADPGVSEEARGIIEATARGKQMTRALLTFARGGTAANQRTSIADFVQENGSLMQRLLGRSIELSVHTEQGLPEVDLDQTGFSQVLFNLAVNARDAMRNGGSIRIDVGQTELCGAAAASLEVAQGHYIHISVTDTGSGIAPELLDRIFEPWVTNKEGEGTGLGLATAYGFARANGGSITVQTEVDTGTTFHLYLPVRQRPATRA